MSFSRPIQWYLSHVDPIWPDGGRYLKGTIEKVVINRFMLKKKKFDLKFLIQVQSSKPINTKMPLIA